MDGVSVSQLYDMRSDKEERRQGGFPPEGEDESAALNFDEGGNTGNSSTSMVATGSTALSKAALGGRGERGRLSEAKSAGLKDVERKLAEVRISRMHACAPPPLTHPPRE